MVNDEMKKAIQFYKTEEASPAPKSAVLTGGTAGMKDISNTFTNLLGIEVVVGNPFSKVQVDPEMAKTLVNYAPLYSIAVGLSMRDI